MRKIGNYKVDDKPIGQGGMGQVLRGKSPDGVSVAIKEILPQFVSDPEYRVRIEREITFLMQFDDPSVVRIYDHFELNGNLYIVMELVEGLNIEDYVNEHGAIPFKDALGYMVKLLDAMSHVHEKGIIHRDIKPGNIMIRPNGDICLLDFGVAKIDNPNGMNNHTATQLGAIIGTDGYMSPEQAAGMTIDRRADIYALGCVMFFMLTGRHAYPKLSSDFETSYAILNNPFPRLDSVVGGIPEVVQEYLDKAVNRNMMQRYQTATAFRNDLQNLLTNGTSIRSRSVNRNIQLTIGREGCDILMDENNYRISRHHATITRKAFTGGTYYVFTDCSSNGTLIDGMVYTKGMSYNIRQGEYPTIMLAGEPSCRLDIRGITQRLDDMAEKAMQEEFGTPMPAGGGYRNPAGGSYGSPTPPPTGGGKYSDADSMIQAFKNVFNNYANFKGRAGRGEYWWWVLFNIIIVTIFALIFIATDFNENVYYVLGVWDLVTLLPGMAVGVRRFHDTGKSAWIYFLLLLFSGFVIPAILMLVLLCKKGEAGPNKYGPGAGQLPRGRGNGMPYGY